MMFSIIIPVYNVEKYLRRCLNSILAQTFTDWECILVDDGSTDDSSKICDLYQIKDDRIKVIHQENKGVSAARNAGLKACRGKYIWFIDSDDWVDTLSLENFYDKLIINDVDILFFGLVETPSNKRFDLKDFPFECCEGKKECAKLISLLERAGLFGWTVNKIFRKSILERTNLLFDSRFSIQEDHLFTLDYMKNVNKMQVLHFYPYFYEQKEDSLIHKKLPFDNVATRNLTMYQKRRDLMQVFDLQRSIYEKWFTTDFVSREIRNLKNMKRTNLPISRKREEIDRVKKLIVQEKLLKNRTIMKFRVVSWIPSCILSFVM